MISAPKKSPKPTAVINMKARPLYSKVPNIAASHQGAGHWLVELNCAFDGTTREEAATISIDDRPILNAVGCARNPLTRQKMQSTSGKPNASRGPAKNRRKSMGSNLMWTAILCEIFWPDGQ